MYPSANLAMYKDRTASVIHHAETPLLHLFNARVHFFSFPSRGFATKASKTKEHAFWSHVWLLGTLKSTTLVGWILAKIALFWYSGVFTYGCLLLVFPDRCLS